MTVLYPGFKETRVVQEWAGYIDVTPDVIPYIGPLGAVPGLIVATGFSGHGLGSDPPRDSLRRSLRSAPPHHRSSRRLFRTSRFGDGSPIVIGPEI